MKLSDFSIKVPPRKQTSTVFNLNNELQEEKAAKKIKALEVERTVLKKELEQLRPLPESIILLEEGLQNKERHINTLKKTSEQEKILLRRAEDKVSQFSQQEEEIKRLREVEKSLANQKIDIERELQKSFDEFHRIKNEYNDRSQALAEMVVERDTLKSELDVLTPSHSTLQEEYFKVKNLYIESSKINIENENELLRIKTERNYLAVDNNAAREKISMLETVKNKLEGWASSLTKTNVDSTSKLAAFEQTVQNSKDVMIDMSEQIQRLMAERETSIARIQYLTHELMKPKVFNETSMLRAARLPTGAEAVHRQYIGHGKPTMLKFKVIEEEKNVLTV